LGAKSGKNFSGEECSSFNTLIKSEVPEELLEEKRGGESDAEGGGHWAEMRWRTLKSSGLSKNPPPELEGRSLLYGEGEAEGGGSPSQGNMSCF